MSGQRVDLARQPALVPGGSVVVDDALLDRAVDLAHGLGEQLLRGLAIAGGDRGPELADLGLHLGEILPVAGPALPALPHLLQAGRMTCCHSLPPLVDGKTTV